MKYWKKKIMISVVALSVMILSLNAFASTTQNDNNQVRTAGVADILRTADLYQLDETIDEADPDTIGVAGVSELFNEIDSISETEWNLIASFQGEAEGIAASLYANDPVTITYWGYQVLGVLNANESLNIRAASNDNSEIIGQMPVNSGCEILNEENDYYYVTSGNVTGFVAKEYILTGESAKERAEQVQFIAATVTAQNLKVRKEATTNSGVRGMIKRNSVWMVENETDGWIQITYDNEKSFVSADYVTVGYALDTAMTMTEVKYGRGVTNVGINIAEYAVQYVGNPYVYGGTSLTKGADCSGFTLTIYKKYGVTMSHSARAQSKLGTSVAISELLPGDLVFYSDSTGINHVTIYIGNGQVVHASNPRNGIMISDLYYRTPTCARRVI